MAENSTDLLAYIILKGSDALAAESTAELTKGDMTTFDFKAGKYFEAEDFSFGIKLDDHEPKKDEDDKADADTRSFARWRRISAMDSARGNDKVDPPFRSAPDNFEFTRNIDTASPILIENCLNSKEFSKLVVVKRARTGDDTLSGMVRFVFTKVRIKSIDWSDGDVVKETCKFNFETAEVKYLRQSAEGKTEAEFRCEWKRQKS